MDAVLVMIAALSAFLNMFYIWNNAYGNAYYTAAVTSMLQSWHNFFYASLDPAGFITVDKPPLAFWVQTLFAYVFGVHGWSVILPQALAGVGSVVMVYYLVKPNFDKTAARLASLVMACSPIAVAVSRTNNIDSLLVFTLLLGCWMLFKGVRSLKTIWVLGAFAVVGVGFNEKMLQAYLVVPAFYLYYLLASRTAWKRKAVVLGAATVILVGVSLSWAVVVDLTPQANRPYIGGSKTNSVLELALGYNGMSRLTGMGGPGGAGPGGGPGIPEATRSTQQPGQPEGGIPEDRPIENQASPGPAENNSSQPSPLPGGIMPNEHMPGGMNPDGDRGQMPGPGGNNGKADGGGSFGTGQPGPLRLFQSELSGQISWLLPLVGFACISLLAGLGRKKHMTEKQNQTLFWMAWLLPAMVFFSIAGFYHHYYLIMLAPPIAVLAGAGWVSMIKQYHNRQGWERWLLPLALLATTVFELYILYPYQHQIGAAWLIGIGTVCAGLTLLLLLAPNKERVTSIAAIAAILILLMGPLYWAATPLLYGDNNVMPQAGPGQGSPGGRQPNAIGDTAGNDRLVEYISQNLTDEKYFFITTDASTAESYIISTGNAVVAMGGFTGSDPALTVEKLKQMVENGEVKYFLIPSGSDHRGGENSSEVLAWIRAHSTEVPPEQWQPSSTQNSPPGWEQGKTHYMINR